MKMLASILACLGFAFSTCAMAGWDSAMLEDVEVVGNYGAQSVFLCHYKVMIYDYAFSIRRVGYSHFSVCPTFVSYNVEKNEVRFN